MASYSDHVEDSVGYEFQMIALDYWKIQANHCAWDWTPVVRLEMIRRQFTQNASLMTGQSGDSALFSSGADSLGNSIQLKSTIL